MPLENGLRRVRKNSVEHDQFLEAGYVPIEEDGTDVILRLARRSSDRLVTNADTIRYRALERKVLEGIAAEFQAVGHVIDAAQLRWAMDEFRVRIMRAGDGRHIVSGKLR